MDFSIAGRQKAALKRGLLLRVLCILWYQPKKLVICAYRTKAMPMGVMTL